MKTIARKRFGQHFLHDKDIINRISNYVIPQENEYLVEIGPGRGALTIPLLENLGKLHVIEIDIELANYLESLPEYANKLTVLRDDVLKVDFSSLSKHKLFIIGNLPYNISTPLLFHLLEYREYISRMVFMLQKEVAERICAEPDTKQYGRLTVMVQASCNTKILFEVPSSSFTPRPKVESAVIELIPANQDPMPVDIIKILESVVRSAFSKRRKTLRNALANLVSEEMFESLGIDPQCRPENIPVNTYISMANKLYNLRKGFNE